MAEEKTFSPLGYMLLDIFISTELADGDLSGKFTGVVDPIIYQTPHNM